MSIDGLGFLGAVAVILLLLAQRWWKVRSANPEIAWRPKELRDARLAYAEQTFRAGGTLPVVAKLDRAYRARGGEIILVELKTRRVSRTYLSDVIELSAQRHALQLQTGESVSEFAYVLIQRPGRPAKSAHRVRLPSSEQLHELAQRREALLSGQGEAQPACSIGLCIRCAFRRECKPGFWQPHRSQ